MKPVAIPRRKPSRKPSEDGFILIAVMFLLALLIISMAVALPKVAADIQRDRELETMHRGMQYRRAIQLYYRKFHRYPPNIEALIETNEIRFLRKKYKDPTTGKDEWKAIMFGQNKTPMAMGFFGQPLSGIGTGMAGGVMPGGGMDPGIAGGALAGGSSFGSSNSGGSMFAPSNAAGAGTTGSTDGSKNTTGTTDANGNPTDPNAQGNQLAGAAFGGAGIIGVSPMSPKQSILSYKKKTKYNEWEFLYSPLSDQMTFGGGNNGGGIQPSPPGVGAPGTPFSPSGGSGTTTPSPSPSPTPQPQQ